MGDVISAPAEKRPSHTVTGAPNWNSPRTSAISAGSIPLIVSVIPFASTEAPSSIVETPPRVPIPAHA